MGIAPWAALRRRREVSIRRLGRSKTSERRVQQALRRQRVETQAGIADCDPAFRSARFQRRAVRRGKAAVAGARRRDAEVEHGQSAEHRPNTQTTKIRPSTVDRQYGVYDIVDDVPHFRSEEPPVKGAVEIEHLVDAQVEVLPGGEIVCESEIEIQPRYIGQEG